METDRRSEIAASLAAHQDLGPGYEQVLAEGLVERISAEIDDRISAQIDDRVAAQVDARVAAQLDAHVGCRHVRRARARAARSRRPSVLLALGSMAVATAASAIVLIPGSQQAMANGSTIRTGPGSGSLALTALIWIIIAVINVAYAQHQQH